MPTRRSGIHFSVNLCAEILGIMIRNNMNISGIIINDKEHKLSQYADDTLFLLDGTSKSLNARLNVLYEYSQFSGLKVNFEKNSCCMDRG